MHLNHLERPSSLVYSFKQPRRHGIRTRHWVPYVLATAMASVAFISTAVNASGLVPEIQFKATLEGRCTTTQGGAVPAGTTIVLQTLNGEVVARQPVYSDGTFKIDDLEKIGYLLTVKADGFQPFEQQVDLKYATYDEFINIALTPISTTVRRPPPALTDLKAPKEAQKEYELARQEIERKNARQAESHLESAVRIYPCYARAQTDLGLVLSTLHKFEEAEKSLRKAISCDPGFVDSYTVLGQLLNAEKHYDKSEAVLEEGLRLSPGAWQFYAELGNAEFGQGDFPAAAQEFQKAEEMTPPPPADIHVKLANAYVKLHYFDQAYNEMAAYLQAQPNGAFAPRIKQIMGQMKSAGVLHGDSTAGKSQAAPK